MRPSELKFLYLISRLLYGLLLDIFCCWKILLGSRGFPQPQKDSGWKKKLSIPLWPPPPPHLFFAKTYSWRSMGPNELRDLRFRIGCLNPSPRARGFFVLWSGRRKQRASSRLVRVTLGVRWQVVGGNEMDLIRPLWIWG